MSRLEIEKGHTRALTRRDLLKSACASACAGTLPLLFAADSVAWEPLRRALGPNFPRSLLPGDVLAVRNESENEVPGHFQHLAVFNGQHQGSNTVIEPTFGSTFRSSTVQQTQLEAFLNRYETIAVYRLKLLAETYGPKLAAYAAQLVNLAGLGVFPLWWREGYTAALMLRYAFLKTKGFDPGWIIVDHVVASRSFKWIGANS